MQLYLDKPYSGICHNVPANVDAYTARCKDVWKNSITNNCGTQTREK